MNATSPRVFSFHSFKGGVGKTTLALMLAGRLSESVGARSPNVCFLNLDFFGSPIIRNAQEGDLVGPLLRYDRHAANRYGFTASLKAAKLSVVTLTRGGDNDPDPKRGEFSLAYFGVDIKAVQDLAPSSLNEWQCEYIATRVVELIHHMHSEGIEIAGGGDNKTKPTYFIIDNAPGLHGLAQSIMQRITATESWKTGPPP